MASFVLSLLLVMALSFESISCYHIFVSAITASFGHWTTLLHLSKQILSRNNKHFITFMIDEQCEHFLQSITENEQFDKASYQIIYTHSSERQRRVEQSTNVQIDVHDGLINDASASFLSKAIFLNHSQSDYADKSNLEYLLNYNLKSKHNDISLLRFDKVDLCLLDAFSFFDQSLCRKLFEIPTVIHMIPALLSKAELYAVRNSFIYLTDPFALDFYSKMERGSIMSYEQKWINVATNFGFVIAQKLTSHFRMNPILNDFNKMLSALSIAKAFDLRNYQNGFADYWDNAVILSSLSMPFTPISYRRQRVKQFGFLIFPPLPLSDASLLEWIENENSPILLISMGSIHLLPPKIFQTIYQILVSFFLVSSRWW